MNTDTLTRRGLSFLVALVAAVCSFSCNESLPTYVQPKNIVSIRVGTVEQLDDHLAPPGRQVVHITVLGQNTYDEVFWDSVNIQGTMRIWWKRIPVRYRTLYLTEKNFTDRSMIHNGKMLLVPGAQFSLDVYWNMKSDDGLYLPSQMDFSNLNYKTCSPNVSCANPEDFVIEVSLNVYKRLGFLQAPPFEFTFIGRVCKAGGYPPCM